MRGDRGEVDRLIIDLNNYEEKLHTHIEHIFEPYLDRLVAGDVSFQYTSDGFFAVAHYMAVQFVRTKAMQVKILTATKDLKGIDTSKIWHIQRHILATNLSFSMYMDRKNHLIVLLKNDTGVNLITGDQPIFNVHPPHESLMSLYYPISPSLAIFLTDEPEDMKDDVVNLSEDDVARYNKLIITQSYEQIYANSRETLSNLLDVTATT